MQLDYKSSIVLSSSVQHYKRGRVSISGDVGHERSCGPVGRNCLCYQEPGGEVVAPIFTHVNIWTGDDTSVYGLSKEEFLNKVASCGAVDALAGISAGLSVGGVENSAVAGVKSAFTGLSVGVGDRNE